MTKNQQYYQEHKEEYRQRALRYKAERKLDPVKHEMFKAKRLEYQRQRLKDPEVKEKRNEWKRAALKRQTEEAQKDPVAIAALRAKRKAARIKWLENLKATNPEKYEAYKADLRKRQAVAAAKQRQKPEYSGRVSAYYRQRRDEDPQFRLLQAIRNTINSALRGRYKAGTFIDLLGCTQSELVAHLEDQFTEGMNWESYGNRPDKWTVDHIVPCASFNLSDPDHQKKCFHYTNLRPMWFVENCKKNSRHDGKRYYHSESDLSVVG